MDALMKQLYTFVLPHLNQQNINEGMGLLFKISDQLNKLDTTIQVLNTKNTHLVEENLFYKSQLIELMKEFIKDLSKLDNTNVTNMLQMTKYQLEEHKNIKHMNSTNVDSMEKST